MISIEELRFALIQIQGKGLEKEQQRNRLLMLSFVSFMVFLCAVFEIWVSVANHLAVTEVDGWLATNQGKFDKYTKCVNLYKI